MSPSSFLPTLCSTFHRAKPLHSPDDKLTSLTCSFGYVTPKSSRPRKTCGHLMYRYDRFHTHTQIKHKLTALSMHSHHHLRSLWLYPFSCRQPHHPRPAKCRLQNRKPESALEPCFWPSQILDSTSCRPWSTPSSHQEVLHDPWLTRTTTTTDTSPDVDPSPTLRHNWSPSVNWHSALTGIKAANRFSYFSAAAAAASPLSTQRMEWSRSESTRRLSSIVEGGGEGWSLSRRHYVWFFWTCSSKTVASLDRGSWKNLDDFLMLLHVDSKIILHLTKNKRE